MSGVADTARVISRDRVVAVVALIMLSVFAWLYVWRGAGMGMSALEMSKFALFPHLTPEPMPDMEMPVISWLTVVLMWWVMMIAMMTPSASPFVLLYGRVMRHAAAQKTTRALYVPSAFVIAGYLGIWLAFSLLAAGFQVLLQRSALISSTMLWSQSAVLSAALLFLAGIYQLSPLKRVCLKHCRSPAQYLATHMRQGKWGGLRMGVGHGMWCVGCCWMLMALLFVGGVMNIVWVALLTILVLIEKLAPGGAIAGRIVGVVFMIWGVATLVV
jgi:predicted metal-binding membrane protein